jgi:hypothetical protein
MPEAGAPISPGAVCHEIDFLACVHEGQLERVVVVRREDELVRQLAFSQDRRQARQEPVQRSRRVLGFEKTVQLVVERAVATCGERKLRDAHQIRGIRSRIVKVRSEVLRQLAPAW